MLFLLLLPFLLFKFLNAGVRLSDTNVYFLTANLLTQGKMLYRDIFFTNLPLFPYISVFYQFITGGNIVAFYATSAIEAAAVAVLVFLIVQKRQKDPSAAYLSAASYLFSFIVLSTSDHQTGVFTASLLVLLSYYLYLKKRIVWSGVFMGATLAAKAYFLPILIADVLAMLIKKDKNIFKFLTGTAAAIFIIILPSLLWARQDFFTDLFGYSLSRPAGLSKARIVAFFITHDPLLIIAFLFTLFAWRKNIFLALVSLMSVVFVLLYKDVYYLYLNILAPYLAIAVGDMFGAAKRMWSPKISVERIFTIVVVCAAFYALFPYLTKFAKVQKFEQFNEAVAAIKQARPQRLYGAADIAPALSYASGVPLVSGIVDTNPTLFRRGILDAKKLTDEALTARTLVIAQGVHYPPHVSELLFDEIYDKKKIKASCALLQSFDIVTEGATNRLSLFTCY